MKESLQHTNLAARAQRIRISSADGTDVGCVACGVFLVLPQESPSISTCREDFDKTGVVNHYMLGSTMNYLLPARPRGSRTGRLLARSALGGLLLLATSSAEAGGETALDVPVHTVRSGDGTVFVALYDRPHWLQPGRFVTATKVRAHKGTVYARFRGVRPGRYGIAVFHDENNNGKVDTNFLGLPKEGFGFSRITPMRKPSFDETSFELKKRARAPVRLRY